MATAVNSLEQTSTSFVDIKTYNETYRVYAKQGADGKIDPKDISVTTSGKEESAWKKLESEGYINMLEQTFKLYEPSTLAGFQQLVTDPEEQVNIVVRGTKQKFGQELKKLVTEVSEDGLSFTFDPQPEPYDTLDLLNRETRRRNQNPLDKAFKNFKEGAKALFPNIEGAELDAKIAEFLAKLQS